MNKLECVVTKVLHGPDKRSSGFWSVEVEYNCWGSVQKNILYFDTEEEAAAVKPGYKYDS